MRTIEFRLRLAEKQVPRALAKSYHSRRKFAIESWRSVAGHSWPSVASSAIHDDLLQAFVLGFSRAFMVSSWSFLRGVATRDLRWEMSQKRAMQSNTIRSLALMTCVNVRNPERPIMCSIKRELFIRAVENWIANDHVEDETILTHYRRGVPA